MPDEDARLEILRVVTARMRLGPTTDPDAQINLSSTPASVVPGSQVSAPLPANGFDYRAIARATPGYVGADIVALAKEAAVCAVNRAFSRLFNSTDMGGETKSVGSGSASEVAASAAADAWQQSTAALRSSAPLTPEQMIGLCVSFDDFMAALPKVQPAATREGFATIPNVTWADVGALAKVRGDLEMAIVQVQRGV